MSMHITHPSITTIGKKKGKKKWASAEQKRNAQEANADWQKKQKEWAAMSPLYNKKIITKSGDLLNITQNTPRNNKSIGESLNSWHTGPVNTGKKPQVYTGTEMLGITVLHKSCLQPVFSQEAAIDAATMRR